MNGLTVSNINRAIINGEKKGVFVLPKGASGKVKLAKGASHDKEVSHTRLINDILSSSYRIVLLPPSPLNAASPSPKTTLRRRRMLLRPPSLLPPRKLLLLPPLLRR
jgi:histone H1/5